MKGNVKFFIEDQGRVFPVQGPDVSQSFWSSENSSDLLRKFVALAPRGATLEFAVDRLTTEFQEGVRLLQTNPGVVCQEAGISQANVDELLSLYGTNVRIREYYSRYRCESSFS